LKQWTFGSCSTPQAVETLERNFENMGREVLSLRTFLQPKERHFVERPNFNEKEKRVPKGKAEEDKHRMQWNKEKQNGREKDLSRRELWLNDLKSRKKENLYYIKFGKGDVRKY